MYFRTIRWVLDTVGLDRFPGRTHGTLLKLRPGTFTTLRNSAENELFVKRLPERACQLGLRQGQGARSLHLVARERLKSLSRPHIGFRKVVLMSSSKIVRLHPGKFWCATKLMSVEEREVLIDAIVRLAEAGDVDGLQHFGFITLREKMAA